MMSSNTKKRRVGLSGGDGAPSLPSDDGDINNGLVHEELKTISSHMTSMMQMMSTMKGEITRLTEKCDRMEKSIEVMKESQDNMQVTQTTISEKMNSRFDDVDIKLKYHEVLLRNQKWKYSAPRPSPEYWDGLDEDEAEVEGFLKDIKQRTQEMRYGIGDGDVSIDAVLPFNEEFLPHWKEFANAIEQHQYRLKCLPKDTDTQLYLCDMELSDTVIELLSKALESTHFKTFLLRNNSLGQRGIEFALKYLKSNCILKVFGFNHNPIECITKVKQLCQIVEEHPSIEKLVLGGCRGGAVDGYEMLQMIMNAGENKLKLVDLSNNNVSTGGDTFISDFFVGNPIMETIHLRNNQLDDNDAIAIAGALKHNTNLRSLYLRNNNISKSGWEALRKAEFDDTSLNSAADSNHTCTIFYPSGDDEIQGFDAVEMNGNSQYNFTPDYVRQKKVYSILSSRNRKCSNVGHFDDIPVELLPDMLSTIQQYSEYHTGGTNIDQGLHDVNPLSLVYEVCRYWDKSLSVYELLSS